MLVNSGTEVLGLHSSQLTGWKVKLTFLIQYDVTIIIRRDLTVNKRFGTVNNFKNFVK